MKISHCKILKKDQLRLLEFFVLEVTARSAADLVGIQANTAALFYHKIRQVIAAQLDLQAEEMLGVISVAPAKENVAEVRQEK